MFISSASAYQTQPARLPVTESTPLRIPFWHLADASRQVADSALDALMDKLADDFAVS